MKFKFILSLVVAICGFIPAYAEDEVESIFDGKTLDGWNCRPSSQSNNWSVEKGQIIGRGKGQESYLMFNDQLGDFELRFSYKLISDEGNTGVEVRSHPVKGKASRLHGYHADIGHIGIGDKVLGAWDFHENNRGDGCESSFRKRFQRDACLSSFLSQVFCQSFDHHNEHDQDHATFHCKLP